jgi:hypothetical protein
VLIGTFIISLPTATSAIPPLPKVQVIKQPADALEGIRNPVEGWLIAHSDGFWHLFVVVEKQPEFLSVPDDQVLAVRIPRESTQLPVEDALTNESKSESEPPK